jgi:glutamate/aspartate transport system substrate-binding protein
MSYKMKYAIAMMALITMLFSGTGSAAGTSTLEQIKISKTIRIGYRDDKPPMSYLNQKKQLMGYSIDLCERIVAEVKSTLQTPDIVTKYVRVNASTRFEALRDNSIDILCGATTKTLSRSELVDFTEHTFITGAALLSLNTFPIKQISDLAGKKIAAVKNTTTLNSLTKMLESSGSDAKIIQVESTAEAMNALVKGDVHAVTGDQIVLIGLIVTHPNPQQFSLSDNVFSFEPFALAVRQNDSKFRLIADRVLARLYQSKAILPLYEKWFGKYLKKMPTLLEAMYLLNSTPE